MTKKFITLVLTPSVNHLKLFLCLSLTGQIRQSVCSWQAFQRSLMFASEIGNLPNSGATEDASLALLTNMRMGLKGLQRQTPYLILPTGKLQRKSFSTLAPGVNHINFPSLLYMLRDNKLECLSLASPSHKYSTRDLFYRHITII